MLTVIWGEPLLRVLRHLRIGESIRVDGPQRHISKMGTPTLGGVLFILPVLLITVLFSAASMIGLTCAGSFNLPAHGYFDRISEVATFIATIRHDDQQVKIAKFKKEADGKKENSTP